ncbi:MAG: hypothetical protein ACRENI_11610 [Gemmatimonadaceae bacterium]
MVRGFRDALIALLDNQARFLVAGAHALAIHGVPRATVDMDLWMDPRMHNARRVWRALAAFGAPREEFGISEGDLTHDVDCPTA